MTLSNALCNVYCENGVTDSVNGIIHVCMGIPDVIRN